MTTNSKRRIIAIAALLLLVGGTGFYLNYRRTIDNGQDKTAAADITSEKPAEVTSSLAIMPADGTQQNNAGGAIIAAANIVYRNGAKGKQKVTARSERQFDLSAAAFYEGNVLVPAPASNTVTNTKKAKIDFIQSAEPANIQPVYGKRKQKSVNLAPELGVNLNGLYNNNTSNEFANGFHVGIMMNIRISNVLALQPGLMYTMKGGEVMNVSSTTFGEVNTPLEVNTSTKIRLHYIELPLNIVYKFGDIAGKPRFMVGAGPYVSCLVSRQDIVSSATTNDEGFTVNTQKYSTSTTANMKRLDYGIGGFVGCQMPKGFYGKIGTEWGITDIVQDPVNGKMSDRNYNFLLSVGYIIGAKNNVY